MGNIKETNKTEFFPTPEQLTEELVSLIKKYINVEEITEFLENSAGSGAIIDKLKEHFPNIPILAYDVEPRREDIIQTKDYLKEKIEYKKGRIAVINPPFAKGLKFVYKALKESDWCIAILSQNSILNMDYSKVWAEEIQLWRSYNFITTKVSITIMVLRNKTNNDKYEWE